MARQNERRAAVRRGKRDFDVPLLGCADLADLRGFRHGHRRSGHQRAHSEMRWASSWRLFWPIASGRRCWLGSAAAPGPADNGGQEARSMAGETVSATTIINAPAE